jgi:GAF domain-containing protein
MSQHTPSGPTPNNDFNPFLDDEHQSPATSDALSSVTHAELSAIVLSSQPLGAVLRRVAELAVKAVPGVDEASVTLIERGRPRTVAFSGKLAVALDERQYTAGFGPCLDAAVNQQTIVLDTYDEHTSYPEFAREARRAGIRHVMSVGMPALQHTSGGLNIYSSGIAGEFEPQAREAATAFAGYAAATVINAALYAGAVDQVAQMQQAMVSRAGIEQAKGILMARHHLSAEEAFAMLVDKSSHDNRKLRDVATDIVAEATAG